MKFLVIGGDAAGMSAASRARRNNPALDVTVLEQTDDVSYSACGMPYNIAAPDRPVDTLVVRQAHAFREKQGINLLTGHRVTAIDPARRQVSGITVSDGKPFAASYDGTAVFKVFDLQAARTGLTMKEAERFAAVALHNQMTVARFAQCDLSYAPPFGPVWDPLLTAANQLLKKMANF
jgi:hypothetical protein